MVTRADRGGRATVNARRNHTCEHGPAPGQAIQRSPQSCAAAPRAAASVAMAMKVRIGMAVVKALGFMSCRPVHGALVT